MKWNNEYYGVCGELNEVSAISWLNFCDVFHCGSFAIKSWDMLTLKLVFYCPYMIISCWIYVCLFQISFVIDERLRGKGYKRKVTSLSLPLRSFHLSASSIPLFPFQLHILFMIVCYIRCFPSSHVINDILLTHFITFCGELLPWKVNMQIPLQEVLCKLKSLLSVDEALGYAQYVSLAIMLNFLAPCLDHSKLLSIFFNNS